MKKITLLSIFVLVGIFGISQIVFAESAVLSVSPASLEKTAGTSFNVSVGLNPSNNKTCVVKGTLNFDNLSCQSITVANGLMAQTTPTCANPSFTIGIPKCTTAVQNILSISTKGSSAGQAGLALSGVNIIGAGFAVPFNTQNGVYTITAPLIQTPKKPRTTISEPVVTSEKTKIIPETTTTATNVDNPLPASAGAATTTSSGWGAFWALLGLVVAYAVIHLVYHLNKKRKKGQI